MRIIQDNFLLDIDANAGANLAILGENGVHLVIDKKFDPYRHSTRFGIVAECPSRFSPPSIDSEMIKKGDEVIFHHFVAQPKNQWYIDGKELYQAHFTQIFARVNEGYLQPINDWIFIEPIQETEDDIKIGDLYLREHTDVKKGFGTVVAASNLSKKNGVSVGDRLHIIKDVDYEMEIGGKKLWRVRLQQVVCIERDGKLLPLNDKVLVKEDPRPETLMSGDLMLPLSMRSKDVYGEVLEVGEQCKEIVSIGERVCFLHGVFSRHNIYGAWYSLVKKENLIYVI